MKPNRNITFFLPLAIAASCTLACSRADDFSEFELAHKKATELLSRFSADMNEEEHVRLTAEMDTAGKQVGATAWHLAQHHPAAPKTLPALESLLMSDYIGVESHAAEVWDIILQHHTASPHLDELLASVCFWSHLDMRRVEMTLQKQEALMRSVIQNNPSHDAKGIATVTLATALIQRAGHGEGNAEEQKVLLQNIKDLLHTVTTDYLKVQIPWELPPKPTQLGDIAAKLLVECDTLMPGSLAPALDGQYLDGRKFKSTDLKGKAALVLFWEFG